MHWRHLLLSKDQFALKTSSFWKACSHTLSITGKPVARRVPTTAISNCVTGRAQLGSSISLSAEGGHPAQSWPCKGEGEYSLRLHRLQVHKPPSPSICVLLSDLPWDTVPTPPWNFQFNHFPHATHEPTKTLYCSLGLSNSVWFQTLPLTWPHPTWLSNALSSCTPRFAHSPAHGPHSAPPWADPSCPKHPSLTSWPRLGG